MRSIHECGLHCYDINCLQLLYSFLSLHWRASNGEKTVETYTEAVIVKEVLFEESKTGVMKNTSKTIVISCKAKGNPRPEVDFRLYDEFGPFMIKSGLFKVNCSCSEYLH